MDSTSTVVATKLSLDRGERQLWAGRPRQGILFRGSDIFMIPFSILWGGFAVFWEATVILSGGPLLFALFGIPFVLMGLYITVGRFVLDARRRANVTYGVTDQRIVIQSGILRPTVKSLELSTLSDVTVQERADGSGTITFGPTHPFATMYAGMAWPGVPQATSFELIPDARRVYDTIRAAQQATRGRPAV